jgi:hypothetical protein
VDVAMFSNCVGLAVTRVLLRLTVACSGVGVTF